MKKRLGIIRKIKKKHIFLALLAVIVLGGLAKAYSAWVGTTRIAFLNYQAIALGQISHANDNAMGGVETPSGAGHEVLVVGQSAVVPVERPYLVCVVFQLENRPLRRGLAEVGLHAHRVARQV